MHVAEPDRCQRGAGLLDLVLMLAQLRDILAAEDSTVVSQEDHDSGIPLPERAETDFIAAGIGQHDICELCTDGSCHAPIISAEIAIAAPTPAFKAVLGWSARSRWDSWSLLHLSGPAHFILVHIPAHAAAHIIPKTSWLRIFTAASVRSSYHSMLTNLPYS